VAVSTGGSGFTRDRLPLAQIGGLVNAPRCFGAGDQQAVGQRPGQCAAQFSRVGLRTDLVDQRVLDSRQPAAHFLAAVQQRQPLRGGQRIERQVQGALDVGLQRVEHFDDLLAAAR